MPRLPERSHGWVLLLLLAAGISGQEVAPPAAPPKVVIDDQVSIDLQQVYVTVTNRQGDRVLDLQQADFALVDSGAAQKIVTFARGDIPFTAIVLVDASRSMVGEKLAATRRGAASFVHRMQPLDEAKLLFFSGGLEAATPFGNDAGSFLTALDKAEASGGTAIHDFLYLALRELETRQGRRVVILLSDGEDVDSVLQMEEVREVARRSQAQIYWVEPVERGVRTRDLRVNSWRTQANGREQRAVLRRTVEESGGRVIDVGNNQEIEDAFGEILSELRAQYALGYDPAPRRNDGSWRPIAVQIAPRGLVVRTREGYVDL